MSRRIEQINELLKNKLAHLISHEIPLDNGLITVVYVETSSDLKYAKIAVSVLPENRTGTVLEKLKKMSGLFSQVIRKETKLRKIPKFNWVLDTTEKEAAEIEGVFQRIKKGE